MRVNVAVDMASVFSRCHVAMCVHNMWQYVCVPRGAMCACHVTHNVH